MALTVLYGQDLALTVISTVRRGARRGTRTGALSVGKNGDCLGWGGRRHVSGKQVTISGFKLNVYGTGGQVTVSGSKLNVCGTGAARDAARKQGCLAHKKQLPPSGPP